MSGRENIQPATDEWQYQSSNWDSASSIFKRISCVALHDPHAMLLIRYTALQRKRHAPVLP